MGNNPEDFSALKNYPFALQHEAWVVPLETAPFGFDFEFVAWTASETRTLCGICQQRLALGFFGIAVTLSSTFSRV